MPIKELPSRLAYADERKLAEVADELIDKLQADGPAALPPLPPTSPRRRPRRIRTPATVGPTSQCGAGRTVADPGRDALAAVTSRGRCTTPLPGFAALAIATAAGPR